MNQFIIQYKNTCAQPFPFTPTPMTFNSTPTAPTPHSCPQPTLLLHQLHTQIAYFQFPLT